MDDMTEDVVTARVRVEQNDGKWETILTFSGLPLSALPPLPEGVVAQNLLEGRQTFDSREAAEANAAEARKYVADAGPENIARAILGHWHLPVEDKRGRH